MLSDTLSNALSAITNAEKRSKKTCTLHPISATMKKVLELMNKHGYIGKLTETTTSQGKTFTVELTGGINKCGAVKPRHAVKNKNFEKFEKQYLPARDFGFIIVSTSQGIMTHIEAKKKTLGGKLIAYFY